MNTLILNWWERIPPVFQFSGGAFFVFFVLILGWYLKLRLRKQKIEYFLFNNQYHSVDYRTNRNIFPKVVFKKNQILLKNCIRKTIEQIRDDKEIWERTFNKELNGRKIADIRADGSAVRIALV